MRGSPNARWIPCTAVARVSAVVKCWTGDTAAITTYCPSPLFPSTRLLLFFFFFSSSLLISDSLLNPADFLLLSFFFSSFLLSLSIAIPPSSSSLQFYTHHGHRWTGKTRDNRTLENITNEPLSDHQLQSKKDPTISQSTLSHTKSNRRPSLGVPGNPSPSRTSRSLPPRPTRFASRFTTPVSATRVRHIHPEHGNTATDTLRCLHPLR